MIFAHISTQIFLADCLTKTSAKADNLITAVKTRELLDVDIHPNFRTLMEHKAFLSTWCKTFMYTKEKGCFLPKYFERISRTHSREGPFRNITKNQKNQKFATGIICR